MNRTARNFIFLLVLIDSLLLASCQKDIQTPPIETSEGQTSSGQLPESAVQEIALIGPASEPKAEISGMAWCDSNLILLPQYPDRFSKDGVDHVFSIPDSDLDGYLSGQNKDKIDPQWVPFDSDGVEDLIDGFEGFESIVFNGDDFYVSIEAHQCGGIVNWGGMVSYFVKGQVESDCSGLALDKNSMQSQVTPVDIANLSYETLLVYQDRLYAIYEANGQDINPDPTAYVFDLNLGSLMEIGMANIEYRITDATEVDELGYFWAINYFFPRDEELLPEEDLIALTYGIGESHLTSETVERIIKLRVGKNEIELADQEPIYLELLEDDSRNWEGIVRFGDGFLLVTDKFPTTILAFVDGD